MSMTTIAQKQCLHCGQRSPDPDSRFCDTCGSPLRKGTPDLHDPMLGRLLGERFRIVSMVGKVVGDYGDGVGCLMTSKGKGIFNLKVTVAERRNNRLYHVSECIPSAIAACSCQMSEPMHSLSQATRVHEQSAAANELRLHESMQ